MKLAPIDAAIYARDVLPLTAELWAGRRNYETYVAQTNEIATCGYGQRHYRTIGLYDGSKLVASMKRYERTIHFGAHRLQAVGIGALFTPAEFRGRGYASAMLAMMLDQARVDGCDVAYLFSDISPKFYNDLGFTTLPSRSMSVRADGLAGSRIEVQRLEDSDWTGIRRCFELGERLRPWGFVRTPLVWDWVRVRYRHDSEHPIGVQMNLVVRRGRGIAAYILGARAPEHDAYLVDEFGFADAEAALLVGPLLRAAAGDLRRVTGWLPPDPAREALARASVRKRAKAIFMAAPLSRNGGDWLALAGARKSSDGVWSTDHV